MDDLWPDDLMDHEDTIITPLSILKEQASFLGLKTGNLIQGEIMDPGKWTRRDRTRYPFQYRFLVVAPTLGNYRFQLCSVYYDISFYPLLLEVDSDISEEILFEPEATSAVLGSESEFSVDTEDQFLKLLKKIFGSSKLRKVVTALLSQMDE